jgi:hypothetical protein
MLAQGGPDRHRIEGEDALRTFLLTDLEIPPGVTETAMTELANNGRYTIQDTSSLTRSSSFGGWTLHRRQHPSSRAWCPQNHRSEASDSRVTPYHGGHFAKPKPTRKAKPKGRPGR